MIKSTLLVALALSGSAAEFSNFPAPPRAGYAAAVAEAMAVVVELRTRDDHGGVLEDSGTGSGVVVDARGYVLTCFHVVRGSAEVTVDVDGQRLPAVPVAKDEYLDLAIIRVDHAFPKAARWGNSATLRAGDSVLVVGFPFDITKTASLGIISAVGFNLKYPVLVTDAALNPGNSGGGLFDSRGCLVGVPHRLFSPDERRAFSGIGFAIPGNTARLFVGRSVPVP